MYLHGDIYEGGGGKGGGREAERDICIGIHGWEMGARRYAYTCVGCKSFA